MSKSLSMYPLLEPEQITGAGFRSEQPVFSYLSEDDEERLMELRDCEGNDNKYRAFLRDPVCEWTPGGSHMHLSHEVCLDDVSVWFGKNGICAENAILGLAFRWSSDGTKMQRTIPFAEINRTDRNKVLSVSCEFEAGALKNSLRLETLVYLKQPGIPRRDEKILCSVPGTVLGVLDQYIVFLEGNGSVFPIANVQESGKPLWYVRVSSEDVLSDKFNDEYTVIYLNEGHPDFKYINQSSKETFCSAMFREVLASALTLLVMVIKKTAEDQGAWENILQGDGYEDGSVADAMNYFMKHLHWDMTDQATISESVHLFIDKNMKGELA